LATDTADADGGNDCFKFVVLMKTATRTKNCPDPDRDPDDVAGRNALVASNDVVGRNGLDASNDEVKSVKTKREAVTVSMS
jgi:hypothetical protein